MLQVDGMRLFTDELGGEEANAEDGEGVGEVMKDLELGVKS